MTCRNFKDYTVWQEAMNLARKIYELIRKLPNEERFALCDQMRRAAVSVPSNIAEGKGRGSDKEFIRFLNIAKGSTVELETQLLLCERFDYLTNKDIKEAIESCHYVVKMINRINYN